MAKAKNFDVFLPLRLEDWDNEKTIHQAKIEGEKASSLEVDTDEGTNVYAIEDGNVSKDPDTRGFILSSANGNRIWVYMNADLDFADTSEVRAGEVIGETFGEFRIAVKDGDNGPRVRGSGTVQEIVLPEDPSELLNKLGVQALPIDEDEGVVDSFSDSPSELTSISFGPKDKITRYALYAGGGLLGAALLYKLIKR